MKACKTCGTEVPDNATSCPTCGGPVGDPVVTADGTQPTPQPSPAEPPKKKHTGLKVIAIIAGIIVAIFIIASCNSACSQQADSTKEDWPTGPLAQMIPSMDRKCASVIEGKDNLSIRVSDRITKSDYDSYVAECKEWGYTIDPEENGDNYQAYNTKGYQVNVSFSNYSKEMSIYLYTPKADGDLTWPTVGLATKIPNPNKTKGNISTDSSSSFSAYVGEMNKNEYEAYIDKCVAAGFDVDYDKYEKSYSAKNAQGFSLRVEYEGFNTVYIAVKAPDDNSASSGSSSSSSSSSSSASSSGSSSSSTSPSADFKKTMDDYEKFVDSYIAFMKKYNSSSNQTSLAADYAKYISDYADLAAEIEAIDEDSLSAADLKYYTDVTTRVSKKLIDASLE